MILALRHGEASPVRARVFPKCVDAASHTTNGQTAFLDVLVLNAEADLLKHGEAISFPCGQTISGHHSETIPNDPLFHRIIPTFQDETPSSTFIEPGGSTQRFSVVAFQDQIAKQFLFLGNHCRQMATDFVFLLKSLGTFCNHPGFTVVAKEAHSPLAPPSEFRPPRTGLDHAFAGVRRCDCARAHQLSGVGQGDPKINEHRSTAHRRWGLPTFKLRFEQSSGNVQTPDALCRRLFTGAQPSAKR